MSVTTTEFEQYLNGWLSEIENWKRCEWCGCDDGQKRIGPRSKLCSSCKEWRRRERLALKWQEENPESARKHEGIPYEYCIQFATMCREEGHINTWTGPITPLNLEWRLQDLTEQFLGRGVFGNTVHFGKFSDAQRRLLMYMIEGMAKARLRHRRRNFAIDAAVTKYLSGPTGAPLSHADTSQLTQRPARRIQPRTPRHAPPEDP
jgi:hypothetical protein